MSKRIIELPDWAIIGKVILVKDVHYIRGENQSWYKEKIVAFGENGIFHQASNCPMYFTPFSEWGKTIKEVNEIKVS